MRRIFLFTLLALMAACTTVEPEVVEVRVKTKDSRLEIAQTPICITTTDEMNDVQKNGVTRCAEAALYKDRKLGTLGEESCIETKLDWTVVEANGQFQKKLRIDFVSNGVNLRSMVATLNSPMPDITDATQSTLCGALFYAFAHREPFMVVPILISAERFK